MIMLSVLNVIVASSIAMFVVSSENPSVSDRQVRSSESKKKLKTSSPPSIPDLDFLFHQNWFSSLKRTRIPTSTAGQIPRPNIQVSSIIISKNTPNSSLATVTYRNKSSVMKIGQSFEDGFVLKRINPNEVIFEKNSTEFSFSIPKPKKARR